MVRCPYNRNGNAKPLSAILADFAPGPDGAMGTGYRTMYDDILVGYAAGYRRVFEELRSADGEQALLFHCTGTFLSRAARALSGNPGMCACVNDSNKERRLTVR